MILQVNHLNGKAAAATTPVIVEALNKLVEEGHIDPAQFANLQVQLDWVQYKQNFREVVSVSRARSKGEHLPPRMDMRIDTRQVTPENLRAEMLRAMAAADPDRTPPQAAELQSQDRILLEDFKSLRFSIAWEFNKLYWGHLADWERVTGKGYQEALPGGKSDGNSPEAVADSVADFWTLLRDMEKKNLSFPPKFSSLKSALEAYPLRHVR